MHHPDVTGQPGDAEEAALAVGRTRYDGVHCGASWRTILDEEVREAFAQSDPALLIPRLVRIAAVAGDWFADLEGRSAADARSECGS
jgi:hypothetical protein